MRKLNKDQIKQKAELVAELGDKYGELEDAHEKLKAAIAEAWGDFEIAQSAYNGALEHARDFANEIADEAESAFNERSEKWQEGDAASAVRDWIGEWQDFDAEESTVEEPTIDDLPGNASEELDILNNAVGG